MKRVQGFLLIFCLAVPPFLFAAEVQNIKVHSSLNQPLIADIPVTHIEREAFMRMNVALAPVDDFDKMGLTMRPLYQQLRFTKAMNRQGEWIVRITSSQPVQDPILSFLVKFNFGQSAIIRQFTLFLDPPGSGQKTNAKEIAVVSVRPKPAAKPRHSQNAALPSAVSMSADQDLVKLQQQKQGSRLFMQDLLPAWLMFTPTLPKEAVQAGKPLEKAAFSKPRAVLPAPLAANPVKTTANNKSSWHLILWLLLLALGTIAAWQYRTLIWSLLDKYKTFFNFKTKRSVKPAAAFDAADSPLEPQIGKQVPHAELDPLEEADVFFKYGRYDQAEQVLLSAIKQNKTRWDLVSKLLEVYAAQARQADFERMAAVIPAEELAADAALGRQIEQLRNQLVNPAIAAENPPRWSLTSEQQALFNQQQDYFSEKLQIAKGCVEMQDYQNAYDILQEIKQGGSERQKQDAIALQKLLPDSNNIDFK